MNQFSEKRTRSKTTLPDSITQELNKSRDTYNFDTRLEQKAIRDQELKERITNSMLAT